MKSIAKFGFSLLIWLIVSLKTSGQERPNVLFILIDDLNDFTTLFDSTNAIRTPNIEKLASRGAFFNKAYCNSPACNPSRVSLLTGLHPHTSGVYGNSTDWQEAIPNAVLLPQYFMSKGYSVVGAGKIFHHAWDDAFFDPFSFEEFYHLPWPVDRPMPKSNLNKTTNWYQKSGEKANKISGNFDWGAKAKNEDDLPDYNTVSWAIDKMDSLSDLQNPFFLAIGLFRPHMPFFVTQQQMDKYPLADLQMPVFKEGDVDDLPSGAIKLLGKKLFWPTIVHEKKRDELYHKKAVQAYQAAATLCDDQVGRLMDALVDKSLIDNTIVVLMSDHGYHLGEKNHWEKFGLWEKTTHVPLIFSGYGSKSMVHDTPVSLVDVYPTLLEMCNLPAQKGLDGVSLASMVSGHFQDRDPVISSYLDGNHSVRDERWRYILYQNGTEELYDHKVDPNEWNNLTTNQEYSAVKNRLKEFVPSNARLGYQNKKQPTSVKSRDSKVSYFDKEGSAFEFSSFDVELVNCEKAKIKWVIEPTLVHDVVLYRKDNTSDYLVVDTLNVGGLSYLDANLEPGLYNYRVTLLNREEVFSELSLLVKDNCTYRGRPLAVVNGNPIRINQDFNIEIYKKGMYSIEFYSLSGDLVDKKKVHISENCEKLGIQHNLKPGMYLVVVSNEKRSSTLKLIVR
ncbi:MAG: sulfatase-like hydrolase/transferase [Cyclobacteriaceae bacterium]